MQIDISSSPATSTRPWADALGLAALAALLVVLYAGTAAWMADRFVAPGSYYAHGPLALLLAGLLAWRALRRPAALEAAESRGGTAWVVAGAVLHLLGSALRVHFVVALSLLPVAYGLVGLLRGSAAARRVRFPVLFLAFAVPAPLWVVANLALKTKIATAEAALLIANSAGLVAIREGATIHLSDGAGSLVVGELCGGLRYTIALLALGALAAHLSRLRPAGRALLFLLAAPVAFAANVVRVLVLLLLAALAGDTAAVTGAAHAVSGMALFLVAALLLLAGERLLGRVTG